MPGRMMMNMGNNLMYDAKMVAPLAWAIFLAANVRWTINCWRTDRVLSYKHLNDLKLKVLSIKIVILTITWSQHQNHVEMKVVRIISPGHGRSELTGSRKMWKASGRGRPHCCVILDMMASVKLWVVFTEVPFITKPSLWEGTASKYL